MKFSKGDWTFTILALLVLLILSFVLYRDFTSGLDAGNRQQVGILTFKKRTAERKYSGSTLWQDMDASVPVYNMDSIRTAGDSEATITLNDGTRIGLEDNTMIVLNFTSDQPAIDFGYGAVQADATGEKGINIKSGDSVISLDGSEAKISGKEDELQLQVQKGEATLKKGEQEQKVQENEVAGLDGNQVQVQKNPLVLVSPSDQSRFFTAESRQAVSFNWNAPGIVTLQVSSDRGFGTIVAQAPRANNAVAAVGPGVYYWRVIQNGQSSPVRRFAVYQQEAPVLQMPLGGSEFAYRDSPPPIQFLWSRLDSVTSYRIVVSQNANLSSPVINEQVIVNSLTRNLGPGKYYWQIQPISGTEGAVSPSGIGNFVITQKEQIAGPIPLTPVNTTIVQGTIERRGLTFSWKKDAEIDAVQIQIASDAGFQNVVSSSNSSSNVFQFTGNLAPGTYYWRLVGSGFPASRVVQFQVADKERIEVVLPSPGESITSLKTATDVRFAWKGGPGTYRVLLSQAADLDGAQSAETTTRSSIFSGLSQGTYFWKVQRMSPDGDLLGESPVLSFKIERNLDKPDLVYPIPGSTVDMTDVEKLTFQWKPVEGATGYIVKLYLMDGTGQKLILTRNVAANAFVLDDLSILDTALFRYSVEAVAPGLQGKAAEAVFRITLRLDKEPEFITPEVIFK